MKSSLIGSSARFVLAFWIGALVAGVVPAHAGGTDPYGNEDPNKKIIKQGVLGAGTGAIAAGASGGQAGKGALIGAGTNVIGGAVLDVLTTPSAPARPVAVQQPVYVTEAPAASAPKKTITRKYDSKGNVIEEQETWQ